jgi:hypothetical protein
MIYSVTASDHAFLYELTRKDPLKGNVCRNLFSFLMDETQINRNVVEILW